MYHMPSITRLKPIDKEKISDKTNKRFLLFLMEIQIAKTINAFKSAGDGSLKKIERNSSYANNSKVLIQISCI